MYPVLVRFGPITLRYYGLMIAVGFFLGAYLANKEAVRKKIDQGFMSDLFTYLLISGIIGARVYYYLFYDLSFFRKPYLIFAFWQGGLAIHGALIAGTVTVIFYSRKKKINFWKVCDVLVPSLALAQSIGRIGCFLNGCCYGAETVVPWGVKFNSLNSLVPYEILGVSVHPVQLYESIACVVIFVLLWLLRKRVHVDGRLTIYYIISYSIARFFLEFFRSDSLYLWGSGIKMAQFISILAILFAFFMIILTKGIWTRKIS